MLEAALILLTWLGWLTAATGIGWLVLLRPSRTWALRTTLQACLWTGLFVFLALAAALNLVVPLASPLATGIALVTLIGGWGILVSQLVRHRAILRKAAGNIVSLRRAPTLAYLMLVVTALVLIANFAGGEPMDYDTGLYRLGLINYARDFATIPGLANLHDRFGFNSSLYPLAAFIEQGLWANEGFRLVAGLLVSALAADLLLRVVVPRRRGATAGDWYLVITTAFLMAVILTDSGRWIPSPAQDIAGYVPAVAAVALLADGLRSTGRERQVLLNLSILTASISGSLRPLGWLLAGLIAVVALAALARSNSLGWRGLGSAVVRLMPAFAASALLLAIMLVRDAVVTGWLLYPAGVAGLNVPWRVPDPTATARAITAWGRAPGQDVEAVLASSDWFKPWLSAFLRTREVYLVGLILLGGVVATPLWRSGRRAWRASWRPMVLTLLPPAGFTVVWFITAPDVRFGWAGLVSWSAVPLAWLLASGAYPRVAVRIAGVVVLTAMLLTQVVNDRVFPRGSARVPTELDWGPISVTTSLASPQHVPATRGRLADGTPIIFPAVGENCWNLFPLCLRSGDSTDVVRRGSTIQEGFAARTPPL